MVDNLFGFQADYQNDSGETYLVLTDDKALRAEIINYQIDMILNNKIPGLIPLFIKEIDSEIMLMYRTTAFLTLDHYLRMNRTPPIEFIKVLINLLQTIDNSNGYLLSEDSFVIDPKYIFIHPKSAELGLVYVPVHIKKKSFAREFQVFIVNLIVQTPSLDAGDKIIQKVLNSLREEVFTVSKFVKKLKGIMDDTENQYEAASLGESHNEMSKKIMAAARETMENSRNQGIGFNWAPTDKGEKSIRGNNDKNNLLTKMLLIVAVTAIIVGVISLLPGLGEGIGDILMKTDFKFLYIGILSFVLLSITGLYMMKKRAKQDKVFSANEKNFNLYCEENIYHDSSNDMGAEFIATALDDQRDETTILSGFDDETTILTGQIPLLKSITRDETIIICKHDFVIGRNQELCDYAIKNKNIGRIHARITNEEEKYFLADIDSKNGTFLNGKRLISNKPYELKEEDIIAFASDEFKFLSDG